MNTIECAPVSKNKRFEELTSGTVFTFPTLSQFYMKVYDDEKNRPVAILLRTGIAYKVESWKEVCPLPVGTKVTMTVNECCGNC